MIKSPKARFPSSLPCEIHVSDSEAYFTGVTAPLTSVLRPLAVARCISLGDRADAHLQQNETGKPDRVSESGKTSGRNHMECARSSEKYIE